ncbi:MAG: hypothetical protein HDR51_05535 [Treponema sp.]|nr:hypothetical protein [Treponema sp.]
MGGGVILFAVAILLVACANSEYDGRIDTVYSLDTPSVSAKAYPGVNVVSWQPVTGANEYKVSVYEEGVFKRSSANSGNSLTDTNLVNGKKYTYYVEAVSASNPGTLDLSRGVYATNSRGEASVTAIVPPAGTSALELPAYESGYDGNTKELKDDKFVVSAENSNITVDKGFVYVNIPAKAYLTYTINIYDTDLSREIEGIDFVKNTSLSDVNSNNAILTKQFNYFSAGKYKVVVNVFALNDIYKNSEVETGEIGIEKLDLEPQTGEPNAEYLSDGKTARISFTPAKKDDLNVPTSWYKVYRRVKGEYATTLVSGSVKEQIDTAITYYVDDEIADKTKVYEYIVVVENDGKYGTAKTAELGIKTNLDLNTETGEPKAEYLYKVNHFVSGADNTIRISFTPAKTAEDGKPVPTSWYKVYRNEDGSLDQTEITSATNKIMTDDKASDTYVVYDTDKSIDPAKNYVYTVVVENDGKTGTAQTGDLSAEEKPTFKIYTPQGDEKTAYNDIEWTFSVRTRSVWGDGLNFGFDAKDVKNVKDVTAYLLVTNDVQKAPKANEVIVKGEKLLPAPTRDTETSTDEEYVYKVSNNNVSEGYAYVVVTATCDGYENAISEVSASYRVEKDSTN